MFNNSPRRAKDAGSLLASESAGVPRRPVGAGAMARFRAAAGALLPNRPVESPSSLSIGQNPTGTAFPSGNRADAERPTAESGTYHASDEEKALADLVQARVRMSAQLRRDKEITWQESLLRYSNKAWGKYLPGSGWVSSRDENASPYKVYASHNKLKPIARKLIQRAFSSEIHYKVKPLSDLPEWIEAAKQARGLVSHLERVCDDINLRLDADKTAIVYQPVAALDMFDPTRLVPIPVLDPLTGQMVGIEQAQEGEVVSELIPMTDVYFDPRGRTEERCRWCIVRKRMSIADIRAMWPGRGDYVVPDMMYSDATGSETTTGIVTGHTVGASHQAERDTCAVFFMWEKPGPDFPDKGPENPGGRYVVQANGIILEEPGPWPYGYMRDLQGRIEFPVTVLHYEPPINTLYSDPALASMLEIQTSRDRLVSKILNDARRTAKLLSHRKNIIKPEAFRAETPDEVVLWGDAERLDIGAEIPPQYLLPPPIDGATVTALELVDKDLQDISEIQDVDNGVAPYSGAPFAAIEALTQQSQSSATLFNEQRRQWAEARMRKRLALARQFYGPVRLLYTQERKEEENDESGGPEGLGTAQVFQEFFQCGVQVYATLTTPELPGQKVARFLEMAQAGMFTADRLPITMALLKNMNLEGMDLLTEDLLAALKMVSEQAQQEMQAEAQANQQTQKAAEQESRETTLQAAEVQTQNTIAIEAAKLVFQYNPGLALQYLQTQGMEEQDARRALGLATEGLPEPQEYEQPELPGNIVGAPQGAGMPPQF